MKRILTIALIAIAGVSAFCSCSKKSSSPSYTMTASLGSSAYNAPNCIAVPTGTTMVIEGIGGTGTVATFPYVQLIIANWATKTGTYSFDSTLAGSYAQYLLNSTTIKISKSGSVVVTSASATTISGTFSFTCTDGTTVTGGTFTATVQ
jgi:hypothetical protein